ncbi:hypothetical protein [Pseudoxanthomonas sp. JBR18]|uniref:hypothetical protein n=1 Tax=Pseudoxanthomonas sp. JBR18 TaxID=2969308 RepID=UPI002306A9E3|nr:hypothetical protein [Pseudoxanthomonas sp. JBR18]WCE05964.1 hypothetical protein PJ250_08455 [Pseudoxanthomonas sp. JBR18]
MIAVWVVAPLSQAQDVAGAPLAVAQQVPPATDAPPARLSAGDEVPTLGEVKALPPDEEEALDLYRFRNPIQVDPNPFAKGYRPPPSPKEISENGGYLAYGLSKLIGAAAKGLQNVPRVRGQIEPATARPPPLSLEQMDRAARVCGADGADCTAPAVVPASP